MINDHERELDPSRIKGGLLSLALIMAGCVLIGGGVVGLFAYIAHHLAK